MNNTTLWITLLLTGVSTFSIRFFFIEMAHHSVSKRTKELLSFIPPAVLSALVFSSVFEKGIASITSDNPYLWASIVAGATAVKFNSMLLTILAGMAVVWIWNSV